MSHVVCKALLGQALDFLIGSDDLCLRQQCLILHDSSGAVVPLHEGDDLMLKLTHYMYGKICELSDSGGRFKLRNLGYDICILEFEIEKFDVVQNLIILNQEAVLEVESLSVSDAEKEFIREQLGI